MGMTREQKAEMVESLRETIVKTKAAVVANYSGLDVKSVDEIRNVFREAQVEYRVVKNTLMKRALAGTPIENLSSLFTGTCAVAFKLDDELGKLGKATKELAKKFENFQVRGAFVENDVHEGEAIVETLASLPTLDEARAQLLGLFNAPAAQLLAQINAPASHVIGVIKAKSEKEV